MLKRRAISPSPSSVDVAMGHCPLDRGQKRRRVAVPVLDGTSRGWSEAFDGSFDDYYEGDEAWVTEKAAGRDAVEPSRQYVEDAIQYRAVNTLLRELHQHHLDRRTQHLPTNTHSDDVRLATSSIPDFSSHKVSEVRNWERTPLTSERLTVAHDMTIPNGGWYDETEEEQVKKHYEGTNRILGDAFLNRRPHDS